MKALLFAVAAAIAVAGCSAGAGPSISNSGPVQIGTLDKDSRAGHEN